jgi:hypothetical protein
LLWLIGFQKANLAHAAEVRVFVIYDPDHEQLTEQRGPGSGD